MADSNPYWDLARWRDRIDDRDPKDMSFNQLERARDHGYGDPDLQVRAQAERDRRDVRNAAQND